MASSAQVNPIGLAELIEQVKRELLDPANSENNVPLLEVEEIELEIAVTVSRKAEAGLNIQVIQLGRGGGRADTHTVRVKLLPLLSHEERLAKLREDSRWDEIVEKEVELTFKGNPKSTQDQYG